MARRWRREGPKLTKLVTKDLRRVSHVATDRATTFAKEETRRRIRAAGLGRLANAVGSRSSLQKRFRNTDEAVGAVFSRGKAGTRSNEALLAYSGGATIVPTGGKKWLAFATDALPKRAGKGRYQSKITPALYRSSGLEQRLGKLQFVRGRNSQVAYLVARKVVVSNKSGRILRGQGGRASRASRNADSVVAFILIRFTRRAQRFDQDQIMRLAASKIPGFAAEFQATRGVA
jgi:hypothetical protein